MYALSGIPEITCVKFSPTHGHRATVEGHDVAITRAEYFRILAGYEVDLTDRCIYASEDYFAWLKQLEEASEPEEPEINEDEVDWRAGSRIGINMF